MQVIPTEELHSPLFEGSGETPLLSREAPHVFTVTDLQCKCVLLVYLSAHPANLPVTVNITLTSFFLPLSPQDTLVYIWTCLLDGDVM